MMFIWILVLEMKLNAVPAYELIILGLILVAMGFTQKKVRFSARCRYITHTYRFIYYPLTLMLTCFFKGGLELLVARTNLATS